MADYCEVCANFPATARARPATVIVELDVRPVTLCRGHARIAENSGVKTFADLRELYGSGRRSHIPRRRPGPWQPDGGSRSLGRRSTDVG